MSDYRLIVEGVDLDVSPVSLPLTYRISDIRFPESRKRNRSKTISLPGTQANLNFFSSVYQLSISDLAGNAITGIKFDPSQRAEAKYYEGGEVIFDGLMQLVGVTEMQGSYDIKVVLFSNFLDLFNQIKDISIADLGWSEYDHTLSRTNIENSWDTSVVVDGVPTVNFSGTLPLAFGYLYGLVDWGYATQLDYISTTDLVPMVYNREIMEKAFEYAGFSYDSSFLDSERYKRVVTSFEGGEKIGLSSSEIAARVGDLDTDFDYSASVLHQSARFIQPPIGSPYYRLDYLMYDYRDFGSGLLSNETFNNGSYDALGTNIVYTVPQKGTYKVAISGTLVADTDHSSAVSNPVVVLSDLAISVKRNGSVVDIYRFSIPLGVSTNVVLDIEKDYKFWNSDQITFELLVRTSVQHNQSDLNSIPSIDWTITDNGSPIELDITCIDGTITDGDTVQIARYLPEMKCSEFLRSQLRMFNLYFSEPDEFGAIKVEPLNDYYSDTDEFDDWTQLLDHSKAKEIIPCGELIQGKRYVFTWQPDDDYYNRDYRNKYAQGYGNHIYEVESTFQTGDVEYDVPYAQTVPVEYKSGFVVPRVVDIDPATGAVIPFRGSPRTFCYNGRQTGSMQLYEDSVPTNVSVFSSYPQMNHLQDLTNADFDLNFGRPEIVYWAASAYTDDNLFKYDEKFLREITGRDSKMFRAYFKLTKVEIKQGFDRLVMLNGVLFRKNLIQDYNNISKESCLVELVRVIDADDPANPGSDVYEPPYRPGNVFDPSPVRINDQYRGSLSVTSDTDASAAYSNYYIDTTSSDVAITLPNPSAYESIQWVIRWSDGGNSATIDTEGDATINGSNDILIATVGDTLIIYNDGQNYFI